MSDLRCPLCHGPLARAPATWRCPAGHAFDVAREGYVNLLPVQLRKSRAPGDSDAMLAARRAFLDAGHYAPLRDAIVATVRDAAPRAIVDVGCGEGHYTAALAAVAADVTGVDIARAAVRMAARRHPALTWLVATAAALPLADASVDLVASLFTPLHAPEARRVLAPGGILLVATPAAGHLAALRAALFDEVRERPSAKAPDAQAAGFELAGEDECRFPLALDGAALRQLVAMTPYAWKASPARRSALEARAGLATSAAFRLLRFRAR